MDITELLKTATNGILTEDVLKEIQTAFNNSVDEKVKIHVEKALVEQDGDYANKLKHLLEVVDRDHTKKLLKVVEAIDINHSAKLKRMVKKFNVEATSDAKNFKNTIVNNVSTYLEAYLDEAIPAKKIQEAVKSKRAEIVLEQIRQILGVNAAVAKNSIRNAIVDGKRQIDEANSRLEATQKELRDIKESYVYAKSQVVLEKKLTTVEGKKKDYLKKVMKGKSAEFIAENFDYARNLFDRSESERLQSLKEEATNKATIRAVDRPVIIESVDVVEESIAGDSYMHPYLQELSKF